MGGRDGTWTPKSKGGSLEEICGREGWDRTPSSKGGGLRSESLTLKEGDWGLDCGAGTEFLGSLGRRGPGARTPGSWHPPVEPTLRGLRRTQARVCGSVSGAHHRGWDLPGPPHPPYFWSPINPSVNLPTCRAPRAEVGGCIVEEDTRGDHYTAS